MIWESAYWKQELFLHATDLQRRRSQRRWPERSMVKLEKTLLLGFYGIRKLLEARKLSDSIRDSRVPVVRYAATGKPVTLLNWHRTDELYDLATPSQFELSLQALCNLFVHSYVLSSLHSSNGGLEAVLVNSDRTRAEVLFQVDVNDVVGLFKMVANDSPAEAHIVLDPSTGDYKVSLTGHFDLFAPDA